MKVLLASAEMAPIARVGGMAEAVAGLVKQLRADGLDVTVVLPDYGDTELVDQQERALTVPDWAGPASVRWGTLPGSELQSLGPVWLIDTPGMAKPHPYNDETGQAFVDNDQRFFSFSAALAALTEEIEPDVLNLNDWHTAAAAGFLTDPPPILLTIHTLGYQGIAGPEWMSRLPRSPEHFEWYGDTNPLLGAIQLADRVVTVSPNYAREILGQHSGMGLHHHLEQIGDRLGGIINGIDVDQWDPGSDIHLPARYSPSNMRGKNANRAALVERFALATDVPTQPIIGMVTRLVEQKGIDLVVDAARFLDGVPAQLVILGSGDAQLAEDLERVAERHPGRIGFENGYDAALSHLIFAGSDMLLMPSRFEPCGLAQMQAMAYGTIPLVTAVGGLVDTVIDADWDNENGTGFVSQSVDTAGIVDTIHRAARAWASTKRRAAIRWRGMDVDWSWAGPAKSYQAIYRELLDD